MEDEYYPKNISHKVERNFLIGNRVKAYFNGRWYPGEIVKRYFEEGQRDKAPYILVKTDEKVDNEPDSLLDGFGLKGKINNLRKIFEWENEETWGDKMYHETITWEMTEEEKREYDNLPF